MAVRILKTETQQKKIKAELIKQLKAKGKYTPYYRDMVEIYMKMRQYIDELEKDIDENGVKDRWIDSNGAERESSNDSVQKYFQQAIRAVAFLNKLGLDEPVIDDDEEM